MALTNFTEDENQKTFIEQFCAVEFIRGVDSELIFLSAINIFLSITAFLGNTLILVALHKETSLHPPSKHTFFKEMIIHRVVKLISLTCFASKSRVSANFSVNSGLAWPLVP